MLHLKSYIGSIVLAGLLLQGCGGASDDEQAQATQTSTEAAKTDKALAGITSTINSLNANSTDEEITTAFTKLKLELSAPESTDANAIQRAGLLSGVTDKLKDGLVNALDSNVGDKVTGAAFDVVLNSEGVTVVMLDAARGSDTITDVMINALESNWQLTEKMCPMLRTNAEFGEKFTALAEEKESIARFFFERIDSNMYNCLADAMLLSNNDAVHDESVSHSTNGYMGILMDRYATDYFIAPTGETADRRSDKFVSLLLDTGAVADYNASTKTFEGHGDANELINEKFFYSLFKTPGTTDSFVSAMDQVDDSTRKMLMDNIFLGNQDNNDTLQGQLNIISIGSAMYDGIYGVADEEGTRSGEYGFSSYAGAFIGFVGLIPGDRYLTYGKAFIGAGYQYAAFHGINVWTGVSEAAKLAWNAFTGPNEEEATTVAQNAPARSAGLGVLGSDWIGDMSDLLWSAYDNFDISISWSGLYDAITGDKAIMDEISDQIKDLQDSGNVAYHTLLDGRDENNNTVYSTELSNGLHVNQDVYGLHGLIELAIQEDLYAVECGNRPYTSALTGLTDECENPDSNYTMTDAKATFTLPPFAEITWSYAYGTASEGAMAYYDNKVDAEWFADLSSNELIRQYFYPSADNVYIPSSLLAIDWLKAANNYNNSEIAGTDFDFNAGYFDIYVTSTNANLFTATVDENNITTVAADIDLEQVVAIIKTIEVTKVDMGSDSIIAVDEAGQTLEGLNVYKVRTISPEDTQAVLTYISDLGDSALSAIGLDSSNAADVDTTDAVNSEEVTVASAE